MLRPALRNRSFRLVRTIRVCAALVLAAAGAGAEILIPEGADVQRIIRSSPPESDFVLGPGTHYGEHIRLRSRDSLRGAPGSRLIGSLDLIEVSDVEILEIRLRSRASDCIRIQDSQSIRVRASEIGPCEGNGIIALHSESLMITDNYIHPEHPVQRCCDTGDGVYARDTVDLRIAGNVIAFGESNVEIQLTHNAKVIGNYLLNPLGPVPRGQQVQVYDESYDVTIEGNSMEANSDPSLPFPEHQEDAVNAGQSNDVDVNGNFIVGGDSPSGCGIIADEDANGMAILDNTLWHTGQCGIGIASGRNHQIIGNKIRNEFVQHPGAGNTAIYVWRQDGGACGPVRVSGQVAYARKPWGEPSSFWKGGPHCDPVTLAQNTFGEEALRALNDEVLEAVRPAIPPQPQSCVAASPFSNNTSKPSCESHPVRSGRRIPVRARTQP